MKINNIKHIFFDLDHTLWDFDRNSALTFDKIFRLHQMEVDMTRFLSIYEPVNLDYWKLYRNSEIDKDKLRYGRLKDTFDRMECVISDERIYLLSEDYMTHLTTFNHLFEHTIDILDYLEPNYGLHIITNGFEDAQYRKMKGSNITHYFKTVTNAEMVGVKKPNSLIFDHALRLANARPDESIMVGDNYEADILGALEVGYDAIFFNYRKDESEAHIKQINCLSELRKYL
ncbi:MAG TPA: YjjG family noncanonical pyrimidine nucleotidase [Aquaticitalea sp.]|nr:YjjG family noncanonical pyrimidine nucleotidase [Aquaticitalea sp.]